jgi:hypothetical protein
MKRNVILEMRMTEPWRGAKEAYQWHDISLEQLANSALSQYQPKSRPDG